MWRKQLTGEITALDDDLFAVLFLAITGLDASLWLVSRGWLLMM
jgi:hypothetical protein